jgi:molecular chaperone GrpE
MIKSLFPVLDNFDRAAKMIKPKTEGEKSINDSYRKLIEVTVGIFEQMGVEIIGEEIVGTPFNASLHEALASLPTDQFPDESVMKVAQKGYVYEGFLLREAQVAVADNEQDREEKQAAMRAEREAQTASD